MATKTHCDFCDRVPATAFTQVTFVGANGECAADLAFWTVKASPYHDNSNRLELCPGCTAIALEQIARLIREKMRKEGG